MAFPGVGEMIGERLRVDAVLGGQGAVVSAMHVRLDERVAVKFLRRPESPELVDRFLQAARLLAMLSGDFVCRASDVGSLASGLPYIVLELAEGADFGQVLRERGPLGIAEAAIYLRAACESVAMVHGRQVVHRDLRPGHLFVTMREDDSVLIKLLDFGSALNTLRAPTAHSGQLVGTPAYMAPEQIAASVVDGRADIWSLGVILFQALTGRLPFEARTIAEMCMRVTNDPAPPVQQLRAEVPAGLAAVIARCLAKQPDERFANVRELALALGAFTA